MFCLANDINKFLQTPMGVLVECQTKYSQKNNTVPVIVVLEVRAWVWGLLNDYLLSVYYSNAIWEFRLDSNLLATVTLFSCLAF